MSFCLSAYLSVCVSVCLLICLSVCLSILLITCRNFLCIYYSLPLTHPTLGSDGRQPVFGESLVRVVHHWRVVVSSPKWVDCIVYIEVPLHSLYAMTNIQQWRFLNGKHLYANSSWQTSERERERFNLLDSHDYVIYRCCKSYFCNNN